MLATEELVGVRFTKLGDRCRIGARPVCTELQNERERLEELCGFSVRHRSGSIRIELDELAVEVCEIRGGAVVEGAAMNAAFGVPAVHFGAARVAWDDSAIHGHPPTFPIPSACEFVISPFVAFPTVGFAFVIGNGISPGRKRRRAGLGCCWRVTRFHKCVKNARPIDAFDRAFFAAKGVDDC